MAYPQYSQTTDYYQGSGYAPAAAGYSATAYTQSTAAYPQTIPHTVAPSLSGELNNLISIILISISSY